MERKTLQDNRENMVSANLACYLLANVQLRLSIVTVWGKLTRSQAHEVKYASLCVWTLSVNSYKWPGWLQLHLCSTSSAIFD